MCLPDRALYDSNAAYRAAKLGLKKAVRQREKRMEMSEARANLPARLG